MAEPVIQSGHREGPMKRLPKNSDVPEVKKQAFLDALADSCNVKAAAAASGFTPSTAYKLRQRDPAFAAAWQEALEIGYARLEMALLERAIQTIETLGDDAPDAPPPVGAMTVAQAMDLMNKHRASVSGGRAKAGRGARRRRPTPDETDAELLRRIDAIERARGAEPGGGTNSEGESGQGTVDFDGGAPPAAELNAAEPCP
jgi:hypothetical protein